MNILLFVLLAFVAVAAAYPGPYPDADPHFHGGWGGEGHHGGHGGWGGEGHHGGHHGGWGGEGHQGGHHGGWGGEHGWGR